MSEKYVSDFVKRQQAIARIPTTRLFWNSNKLGTYVKGQSAQKVIEGMLKK